MSRPRLDAERKKVSFSLAFSPNLIAALERVRGAKSQSVFVEEWLRQHPQIAAELAAMNDPGFVPPMARYERLMELLLAFYWPEGDKQHTRARLLSPKEVKQRTLTYVLFLAARPILTGDPERSDQDTIGQITAAMEEFWMQERSTQGDRTARGESLEAVRPLIQEYAHYYYQVIFQEMAKGEPKLLKQRFRSLVRGCEAVYREHVHPTFEH
jgi:CRISPR type I-D-associated protein Csc3/Cas10d